MTFSLPFCSSLRLGWAVNVKIREKEGTKVRKKERMEIRKKGMNKGKKKKGRM